MCPAYRVYACALRYSQFLTELVVGQSPTNISSLRAESVLGLEMMSLTLPRRVSG
jgi:hypothetical protein